MHLYVSKVKGRVFDEGSFMIDDFRTSFEVTSKRERVMDDEVFGS
jgi:hypothetical protein